jgi:hypothetical protein
MGREEVGELRDSWGFDRWGEAGGLGKMGGIGDKWEGGRGKEEGGGGGLQVMLKNKKSAEEDDRVTKA